MSRGQENLMDNVSSIIKMKKSKSSKTIFNAEKSRSFLAKPKIDILKLLSPPKLNMTMPKPRLSSLSMGEPIILNNIHVKSTMDLKKEKLGVTEDSSCATESCQKTNENAESVTSPKKGSNDINIDNFNTNDLIALTVSGIMLMASQVTVPKEYVQWMERYLSSIRDKNGYHPPNVQGILNHIEYVRLENVEPENLAPSIVSTCCIADVKSYSNSDCSKIKVNQQHVGKKIKNVSIGESKKRTSISRTNSCSTVAGFYKPNQKNK